MAKPTISIDESHPKQDGTCALYLRLFLNGKYILHPMEISEKPENFNKETFQISGKGAKEKNLLINRALGTASDILLKYQVQKRALTKELFLSEFKNPSQLTDFVEFMKSQILMRRGELVDHTIDIQLSVQRTLKEYKSEILKAELSEEFFRNYVNYMIRKLKFETGTVHHHIKTIKTYINRALRMKLMDVNPFHYFKVKTPKPDPEFLSETERDALMTLYKSDNLEANLHKTLRHFLFSCYTGLRISDLRTITHEYIQFGILQFKPKKTLNTSDSKVFIPLSKTAFWLIDEESKNKTGVIFDCYSEQKMNSYMKRIADIAGIKKSITFHTARHTFATIFLKKCKNSNGIIILKNLLGHKKIESTMVYSHVLDSDVRNAIADFD